MNSELQELKDRIAAIERGPAPVRAHPALAVEARRGLVAKLTAVRNSWTRDGARLRAAADRAHVDANEVIRKARIAAEEADDTYGAAENTFRMDEAAILDELKKGASDVLSQLCDAIEGLRRDLRASTARAAEGAGFYDAQRLDRAMYRRDAALSDLGAAIKKTWFELAEDEAQLRARFKEALAKVPSVREIAAEIAKPAPPAPARHVDKGAGNPNVPASAVAAAAAMWTTGPRKSVHWS